MSPSMASTARKLLARIKLGSNSSSDDGPFKHAAAPADLFPPTDPAVDGEDCLHDCTSCSVKFPAKFDIDQKDTVYGNIDAWNAHLIVATGKTDWVRDVADERGSIMEAVDQTKEKPADGKLKLSASNMPLPERHHNPDDSIKETVSTTVILLPAFIFVDNVTPSNVPSLISLINSSPFIGSELPSENGKNELSIPTSQPQLSTRPCPHDYLILLCSQKTRDARCGQSAPLLRREFERQLRPRGLYRDLHDERPGGVGIYFISHVGGHKYSANVLIYRRSGAQHADVPAANGDEAHNGDTRADQNGVPENDTKEELTREAEQCIWLARVRPEDCENIVRYTVLQGKVVKPERQLRGGFDRCRGLTSW